MKQASIPGVTRSVVVNHTPQPRKEACMYYVGLDLGLRNSSLHILDPNGKLFKAREVRGHWDKVVEEVGRLPRPLKVCFEASCGYAVLRLRAPLRQARPPGAAGGGGPPGPAALDLPQQEEEQRLRRCEAGQASVPGPGATGARAGPGRAGLAESDRVPPETAASAGVAQEPDPGALAGAGDRPEDA